MFLKQRRQQLATLDEKHMLTEREVSQLLSISLSRLRQDRMYGRGLPFHKIGRSVRYAYSDIVKFLDSTRVEPTEAAA